MSNTLKKAIAVMLCVIMTLGIAPLSGFVGLELPGFSSLLSVKAKAYSGTYGVLFYKIENGEAAITGCDKNASGELVIPDTIDDCPVTSIGDNAFSYCNNATSVSIPESVNYIGDYAFYNCTTLTKIYYNAINVADKRSNSCVFDNAGIDSDGITVFFGDDVIRIPNSLFCAWQSTSDKVNIVSVEFGKNIMSIGEESFSGCSGITKLTIPENVKSIGNKAFENCNELIEVSLSYGLTDIGSEAFKGSNKLTNIVIPSSVIALGYGAFYGCTKLANITTPNTITSIGYKAFSETAFFFEADNWEDCALYLHGYLLDAQAVSDDYVIKPGTTLIADYAFSGNNWITSITIPNSVKYIGNYAFEDCGKLTDASIGENVSHIGENAFNWCDNLINVIIPDGVETIGKYAFAACKKVKSIKIGKNVKKIDEEVFFNSLSELESITVDPQNTHYEGKGNCLIETDSKTLLYGCKNSSIPDDGSVKIIGSYAFNYCISLEEIIIPNSITTLSGFRGCAGLTHIIIPQSVTEISAYAFLDCIGLCEEVIIPNSVEIIGPGAFSNCKNINKITISDSITSISWEAFSGCAELSDIVIPNAVSYINDQAFKNCSGIKNIIIPDNVKFIGEEAFFGCSKAKYLKIGEKVWNIGTNAFKGCSELEAIVVDPANENYKSIDNCMICSPYSLVLGCKNSVIPNNVTRISDEAFYNCTGLTDIVIPQEITYIGDNAFYGCARLSNLDIPSSVRTIGTNAFKDVKHINYSDDMTASGSPWGALSVNESANLFDEGWLTYSDNTKLKIVKCSLDATGTISIPSSVETIGDNAFKNCTNITKIIIPNSVVSIGNYAFQGCTGIDEITIPNSIMQMGYDLFNNCTGLQAATIEHGVTFLEHGLFANCKNLKKITIPETVSKVEYDVFIGCDSITSAGPIGEGYDYEFGWTSSIPENAFCYLTELKNVLIPTSITKIGEFAFSNCTGIRTAGPIGGGYDYEFGWTSSIPANAFFGCTKLVEVDIPSSVKSIGESAFGGCQSLPDTGFVIPDRVTAIGKNAFSSCFAIKNINLPDSIEIIGEGAFQGTNIKRVNSLGNITEISSNIFWMCNELETIDIPETVVSIGDYAFSGSGLKSILIPSNVNAISTTAFYGCPRLTDIYYVGTEEDWNAFGVTEYIKQYSPYVKLHFTDSQSEHTHIAGKTVEENIQLTDCTQGGKKDLVTYCRICKTELNRETVDISAKEHVFSDWEYYPYGENACKIRICEVCKAEDKQMVEPLSIDVRFEDKENGIIVEGNSAAFKEGTTFEASRDSDSDIINEYVSEICYVSLATDEEYQPLIPVIIKIKLPVGITNDIKAQLELRSSNSDTNTFEKMKTWFEEDYICCLTKSVEAFILFIPKYEKENEISATCTTPGRYEEICYYSYYYEEEVERVELGRKHIEVPALGHSFTNYVYNNDATEGNYGTETAKCDRCDATSTRSRSDAGGHTHSYVAEITKEPSCSEEGVKTFTCTCGDSYTEPVAKLNHTPETITIAATCTEDGAEFQICSVCGEVLSEATVIKATGHNYGEGVITKEPTCKEEGVKTFTCTCGDSYTEPVAKLNHTPGDWVTEKEPTEAEAGKAVKKCTVCGDVLEEKELPKLETVKDEATGVELVFGGDDYDGEAAISVEESFDGAAFNIVNTQTGAIHQAVYDVKLLVDGEETQPNGKIKVKIPVPEGYNPAYTFVYHVNTETGRVEKMNAVYENGFMVFETDHFSYYAVVDETPVNPTSNAKLNVKSSATVDYKANVTVTATAENVPDGYVLAIYEGNTLREKGSNTSVSYKAGTMTANRTFTVKVIDAKNNVQKDANGNELSANCEVKVKFGLFAKIIAFFKGLFGMLPNVEIKP